MMDHLTRRHVRHLLDFLPESVSFRERIADRGGPQRFQDLVELLLREVEHGRQHPAHRGPPLDRLVTAARCLADLGFERRHAARQILGGGLARWRRLRASLLPVRGPRGTGGRLRSASGPAAGRAETRAGGGPSCVLPCRVVGGDESQFPLRRGRSLRGSCGGSRPADRRRARERC